MDEFTALFVLCPVLVVTAFLINNQYQPELGEPFPTFKKNLWLFVAPLFLIIFKVKFYPDLAQPPVNNPNLWENLFSVGLEFFFHLFYIAAWFVNLGLTIIIKLIAVAVERRNEEQREQKTA
jgi:hypothetical protein